MAVVRVLMRVVDVAVVMAVLAVLRVLVVMGERLVWGVLVHGFRKVHFTRRRGGVQPLPLSGQFDTSLARIH